MMHPKLKLALQAELQRMVDGINLIASENYPSSEVLELCGSIFSAKYAEGVPGKRFYSGCVNADDVERLAQDLAKELFGAEYANVQPHSGCNANFIAYQALLRPGDKILAMSMNSGGHLSHGHPLNLASQLYNFAFYNVDPRTQVLNYDEVLLCAQRERPQLLLAGGSAYPRSLDFSRLKNIADSVGALFMVDMAHIAGLVAAGEHENPVLFADVVTSTTHKTLRGPRGGLILCRQQWAQAIDRACMPGVQGGPHINIIAAKAQAFCEAATPDFKLYAQAVKNNAQILADAFARGGWPVIAGGTDTHLLLVDVTKFFGRPSGLDGDMVQKTLEAQGIFVNKNLVPFDTKTPFKPSGIRLGTAAISTQGCDANRMRSIATKIIEVITKMAAINC